MAITSSVIQNDAPQADGRRRVTEAHTDHLGVVHSRTYLADAETDVVAALAPRASQLVAELADAEFARNLTRILARQTTGLTTQHLTLAQLRQRLRAFYQTADRLEVCLLAAFFLTLTDAQLQSLFGVTAGQLPALKARLQARADVLTALESATGE